MAIQQSSEKYWHGLFTLAVCIKAFTGLLETASGLLILFISPQSLMAIVNRLSRGEMMEDPRDVFFIYAHQYVSHLTVGLQMFAGLYILSRGIINLFLIFGLIKQKAWAYLVAIGVMGGFLFYQVLRIALHHSPLLFIVTLFDMVFIVLTWHEYNYLSKQTS